METKLGWADRSDKETAAVTLKRRSFLAGAFAVASAPTLIAVGEALPRLTGLPAQLAEARTQQAGLFMHDDTAGYVMRPHYVGRVSGLEFDQPFRTNARGLRGADLGPKAPDEFRIVVLGDSIVFGGQVPEEQRLTERLEAVLHDRGLSRTRVINVATPGWGTFNEAGYLAANSAWLQPDLVILGLYVGNDIEETVLAVAGGYQAIDRGVGIAWGQRGQSIVTESIEQIPHNFAVGAIQRPPPGPDSHQWHDGDPLPNPASNTIGSIQAASDVGVTLVAQDTYEPPSTLDALRTWLGRNSRMYQGFRDAWFAVRHGYNQPRTLTLFQWQTWILRDLPNWYWFQLAYPLTEHYLSQARLAAESAGARFVAALVPRDAQVIDHKRVQELDSLHLTEAEIDMDRPNRELTKRARRLGIDVIDLLPTMRARPDRGVLTFAHDYHLTAQGHQMVAEALANGLADASLLPSA